MLHCLHKCPAKGVRVKIPRPKHWIQQLRGNSPNYMYVNSALLLTSLFPYTRVHEQQSNSHYFFSPPSTPASMTTSSSTSTCFFPLVILT